MDDREKRLQNRKLVEHAFAAVGRADVSGQLDTFTDDVVLELPYADPPVRLEGKDAIRAHVGPALDIFRFQLHITDVYECADPDTLVLEYFSAGHVTTTGKEYRNTYISVVRFRDGLICHQREYYNPLPAARALKPD
ncbi:MAG TPA: nuclear transport factor 2 family protein [Acidimicrobiales bacterium]|nr:nuclear transport factor 2 family protein [Acidimicrobiales bacterium]